MKEEKELERLRKSTVEIKVKTFRQQSNAKIIAFWQIKLWVYGVCRRVRMKDVVNGMKRKEERIRQRIIRHA